MPRAEVVVILLLLVALATATDQSFAASADKGHAVQATDTVKPPAADKHAAASADKSVVTATNKPSGSSGSGPEQTLIFPNDRSMGDLLKVARTDGLAGLGVIKPHFAQAQGVIKIPADSKIRLQLSYRGAEDPTPLLKLHSKALISIDARDVDNFDDKTLQVISQMKGLWELRLDTTDVTDAGMASLRTMTDLVDLNIGRTLISAAGLDALRSMTSLRRLVVGFNKLTDDSIANLEGLKLEFLSIAAGGVSDKALVHVAKIKTLRALDVFDNKKVTDKGVACLVDLPLIESLALNGTSVDMQALESFKKMKNLKHLVLDPRNFQPADIVALRAALPTCGDVQRFVPRGNISPEVLAPLH